MRLPYYLYNSIRNLCIWFKVIWHDHSWDYHFLFVLMHRKLVLMERFFRKKGCHEDHVWDADKIKECIALLDRIIADEYEDVMEISTDVSELFKIMNEHVLEWWD